MPYAKNEFPQWAKDLRRAEIISFGSLPFVLLQSAIVYTSYRYYDHDFSSSYVPNPLARTSSGANLDEDEQKMLFATSAAISLGLGILDLTIQLIRRYNRKRKLRRAEREKDNNVTIEPIEIEEEEDFPPPPDRDALEREFLENKFDKN